METQVLARFACHAKFGSLPAGVVEKAKFCLLDTLAAAFAGAGQTPIRLMRETLRADAGLQGSSTVMGSHQKASVLFACLLNAAMAQSQELDDFCKTAILHIGSTAIPPALAVAEALGKSGRDLLTAIVVGYEVGIRVGEAVNPSHHTLWHTTGTCGTFAAAAAVGNLLDLDERAMVNALGTAGTQASGLNQYMIDGGEMSKPLHAGKAAMNGCLSALLAEKGFTGATRIFEGEKGFCRATSTNPDLARLVSGLDASKPDYKILSVTQRLYPVNGHILAVLTGLFEILDNMPALRPEDIDRVEVGLYSEAYNFLSPVKASSTFLARFSVPYCVSLAVHERRVVNRLFSQENLQNPALLAFMGKIRLYEDPELTKTFPQKWSSKVRVVTTRGEAIDACTDVAKGDPSRPLDLEDLVEKLQEAAVGCLEEHEACRLAERVMALEAVENMADLF
jgi:2-methylcitrate dehydratase PrpD